MTGKGHRSSDVSRIYAEALELPESARLAFVRRACAGDEALQREVEGLLSWNADVAPLVAALAGHAPLPPLPGTTVTTTLARPEPRTTRCLASGRKPTRIWRCCETRVPSTRVCTR